MKLRNKKTGEIRDFGNLQVYAETENTDASQLLGNFDSFKQIIEYYEDYVTKEPLIKDEKIRKTVRAWAEANGVDTSGLRVSKGSNNTAIVGWVKGRVGGLSIDFETRQVEELEDGKKYTIEELCGEEKE